MSPAARLTILLTTLVLSGCFAEIPTKPGASETDLKRDYRDCQTLALGHAPRNLNPQTGQLEPDAYTVTRDQRRCMQDRGWHYAPVW